MMRTEETVQPLPRSPDWRRGLGRRPKEGRWVARAPRTPKPAVGNALRAAVKEAQASPTKRKPWKLIRTCRKALGWD